jgi:hypothetical protein
VEFLIRRKDGAFVELPAGSDCSIFRPAGFATTLIQGRGVCAVGLEESVVTFSVEMPGIQMVVEGELPAPLAVNFAESVANRLESMTGQALEVVRYA